MEQTVLLEKKTSFSLSLSLSEQHWQQWSFIHEVYVHKAIVHRSLKSYPTQYSTATYFRQVSFPTLQQKDKASWTVQTWPVNAYTRSKNQPTKRKKKKKKNPHTSLLQHQESTQFSGRVQFTVQLWRTSCLNADIRSKRKPCSKVKVPLLSLV